MSSTDAGDNCFKDGNYFFTLGTILIIQLVITTFDCNNVCLVNNREVYVVSHNQNNHTIKGMFQSMKELDKVNSANIWLWILNHAHVHVNHIHHVKCVKTFVYLTNGASMWSYYSGQHSGLDGKNCLSGFSRVWRVCAAWNHI